MRRNRHLTRPSGRAPRLPAPAILVGVILLLGGAVGMRAADQAVDPTLDRIIQAGLASDEVVETYRVLTDVHGPRLSGTPAYEAAAAYVRDRLEGWGIRAHTEEFEFGPGWTLEGLTLEMTAPRYFPLTGYPEAWSPGTGGVLEGPAVYIADRTEAEVRAMGDALRGAIVLPYAPQPAFITEDRPQPTAADEPVDHGAPRFIRGEGTLSRRAVPSLMRELGVGAYFRPDQGAHGTLFVLGSDGTPRDAATSIVLAGEHYNRIVRLLQHGTDVRLRVAVDVAFHDDDTAIPNVIAEIPGTDPAVADEVVMAGAHLDSWHSSTGATDNADGVAAVTEALRLLHAAGVRPRRTIRVGLWGGEEQGLHGSLDWVRRHIREPTESGDGEPQDVVFYVNQDIGGGATYGLYLQENEAWRPVLDRWVAALRPAGARRNVWGRIGSSDHISFERAGVPSFSTIQDYTDYDVRTHHTNADFYERVTPDDLRRSAAFLAGLLYQAAMADELP